MDDRGWRPAKGGASPFAGEAPEDYRTRILGQQAAAAEQRHRDLADQSSALKSPAARIFVWERLHQTRMPRDPTHALIPIIAAHTGLTAEEVLIEQRARFGAPAPG